MTVQSEKELTEERIVSKRCQQKAAPLQKTLQPGLGLESSVCTNHKTLDFGLPLDRRDQSGNVGHNGRHYVSAQIRHTYQLSRMVAKGDYLGLYIKIF